MIHVCALACWILWSIMWGVAVMSTSVTVPDAVSTIMHVRCPNRLGEAAYRQVLELMSELSPVGRRCRRPRLW